MPDIALMGAVYPDVPSIILPKDGGGTAQFYGELKWGVIRPDAEMVKSFSYDKLLITDEKITIPAYSTDSQTLMASETLEETYTMDYNNYNYYILERALTIPYYSINTIAKGRAEYHAAAISYEVVEIPIGGAAALIEPTRVTTARSVTLTTNSVAGRTFYYSNATTLTGVSTTAYGTVQAFVAPTISSAGVITLKTPSASIRGHTSYFTQTYWDAVTDIRCQWIIEVYRAPKLNMNLNGWSQYTQVQRVIECATSSNHKLT